MVISAHSFPGVVDQVVPWTMAFLRIFRFLRTSAPPPHTSPPRSAGPQRDNRRAAVLVIDASPSMGSTDWKPSRIMAAKAAAATYLKRLANEEPDARVEVVTYSGHALLWGGMVSVHDGEHLACVLHSIDAGGNGTNITAGLRQARKSLASEAGARQVILLTDGEHNIGREPYTVAKQLREIAILECVGIGGSPAEVNEKMLKAIASAYPDGTKRYRWIGDTARLVQHFHRLAGRISRQ